MFFTIIIKVINCLSQQKLILIIIFHYYSYYCYFSLSPDCYYLCYYQYLLHPITSVSTPLFFHIINSILIQPFFNIIINTTTIIILINFNVLDNHLHRNYHIHLNHFEASCHILCYRFKITPTKLDCFIISKPILPSLHFDYYIIHFEFI